MNCFQIIKTVLDESYNAIPGDEPTKDAAIKTELVELRRQYAKLLLAGCIDYSNPCKRFAYIYRYTTSHANIVYTIIQRSEILRPLFDQPKLITACIGGGPGSDFLGILKYCLENGKHPELKALILDRDPAWSESWSDVDDKIGPDFRISTVFHPFDVTAPNNWRMFTKHFNADFFTLIYFMSEVYAVRAQAQDYFTTLFSNMRRGAVMLYVDNNAPAFTDWFDSLVVGHNIKIHKSSATDAQLPTGEEKKDLGEYYTKFGSPKLTADIAYRIAEKT